MIIKKYRANSVEEAEQLIRQELGPESIMLTTQIVRESGLKSLFSGTCIEITAAVDEEDLKVYKEAQKLQQPRLEERLNSTPLIAQPAYGISNAVLSQETKDEDYIDHRTYPVKDVWIPSNPATKTPLKSPSTHAYAPTIHKEALQVAEQVSDTTQDFLRASQNLVNHFSHLLQEDAPEVNELPVGPSHEEVKTPTKDQTFSLDEVRLIIQREMEKIETRIRGELTQVKNALEEEKQSALEVNEENLKEDEESLFLQKEVAPLVTFLVNKGIKNSLAEELYRQLNREFGSEGLITTDYERTSRTNALKELIANRVMTTGEFKSNLLKPIILHLVGKSGDGTSLTVAKLAHRYKDKMHQNVGVITLDARPHSYDYLTNLLAEIEITPLLAGSFDELERATVDLIECDLIIIESYNCSPQEEKKLEEMLQKLSASYTIQTQLVISATTKDCDIYATYSKYKFLSPQALIFTKLDATLSYGNIINASTTLQLPISYLGVGCNLSDDLQIAEKNDLARRLLLEYNDQESQRLRALSMN